MNRLLAAVGSVIALIAAQVLTLRETSVSVVWTIAAAAVATGLLVTALSSVKRHGWLVASLCCGAVPPALVVTGPTSVPLRVVLPAALLLLAAELAIFSRDQISIVDDDGKGALPRLGEIGVTVTLGAAAAFVVGVLGRLELGATPVAVVLGTLAIIAVIFLLIPADEPSDEITP